jgi:hypothetical protein
MERILAFLLLGFNLAIFGACAWVYSVDYQEFSQQILSLVGQTQMRSYWETSIFPPAKLELLRVVLPLFGFLSLAGTFWAFPRLSVWAKALNAFLAWSKTALKGFFAPIAQLQGAEKYSVWGFFGIFCAYMGFKIWAYELQYDEAWTYNMLISKGVLACLASPHNNHIFYTLLACLADILPLSGKYALRLPVLLGGIGLWWVFFAGARRYWGVRDSLLLVILLAFSPSVGFYTMFARGYIFLMLATIANLWIGLRLLEQPTHGKGWAVYALVQIFGFYNLPTFFYPALCLNFGLLAGLFLQKKGLKLWLYANLFSLFGCAILFAPQIIGNGLGVLLNAAQHQANAPARAWYLNKMLDWVWFGKDFLGLEWVYGVGMSLWAVGLWRYRAQNGLVLYRILALGWLAYLLLLFAPTHSPERCWVFLNIFDVFAVWGGWELGIRGWSWLVEGQNAIYKGVLKQKLHTVSSITFYISSIFWVFLGIWNTQTHYHLNWSKKLDADALKISNLLMQNTVNELYIYAKYDPPLIEYYYRILGKNLQIYTPYPDSRRFRPFADSLPQAVWFDTEDAPPTLADKRRVLDAHYRLLYRNERVELWIK